MVPRETAYLLATYLEATGQIDCGSSVLEIGAGCGLLSLILGHSGCSVVATEALETLPVRLWLIFYKFQGPYSLATC